MRFNRSLSPVHRPAVTLLELILALSLSALLLMAMGMAINLYFKMLEVRRTNVEEVQISRSVFKLFADDLRANVPNFKLDLTGLETVVANAAGNMSAGLLARIGIPLWAIAAAAFSFLGAAGFGIFSQVLPVALIALLASTSLALTGLIPGSIFATAPKLAPNSAVLAISLGLINQTSNAGNLIGPVAVVRSSFSHDLQSHGVAA